MVSEGLINTVYMWVGMVCGGDVFVTYFRCWSEEVCEFLWWKKNSSWPGANWAEVGEMGHPAQGGGICVDNARCFRIFEKLQNGGVLSN